MSAFDVVYYLLAGIALIGALIVVFTRDMMRMAVGLAVFLLAIAGFFLLYGMAFLAIAQVFVYVGGVLVLLLFAVMAIRRDADGRPELGGRYDLSALIVAVGLFFLMVRTLAPLTAAGTLRESVVDHSVEDLADVLLSAMLPHFELLGALLLVALVASVAIVGARARR